MPTFSSEAYSPPFLPWRLIIMEKEKNISNDSEQASVTTIY